MENHIPLFSLFSFFFLISCSYTNDKQQESMEQLTERVFNLATEQYKNMSVSLNDSTYPKTISSEGRLVTSDIYWWCSGFYPGTLWYIYEYGQSEDIKRLAIEYTEKLSPIQYVTNDHDVGFQLYCSYGNGLRLTNDTTYKTVLYNGAKSLSTRFNEKVGCIKSWDNLRRGWKFPVIIDNMMNLELLTWAAKEYKDQELFCIACKHADTTMKNHFRPDYASYHLVDYDPQSGEVRSQQTVQGFSNGSKWSRGQAWGLYGYTMMYRMSDSVKYLNQAEKIADLIIPILPEDGIPYWDFDSAYIPDDYRDASAGAIIASALIELSGYMVDQIKKDLYLSTAEKQLRSLASKQYLVEKGTNGHFLLKHSVGSIPIKSEVDVPLSYADYYFVEALLRYKKVKDIPKSI